MKFDILAPAEPVVSKVMLTLVAYFDWKFIEVDAWIISSK